MKKLIWVTMIVLLPVTWSGCGLVGNDEDEDAVYPAYLDENENDINDYVEALTHMGDIPEGYAHMPVTGTYPPGFADRGHGFTDSDGDGICDYAQNGSNTWHGPGFVDDDGNGVCDYWDLNHTRHGTHDGMRYRDNDRNGINDYMEEAFHMGGGHGFTDENGDGICDYAQNGGPYWHGPNFIDNNGDGVCDYWERGGRGHGGRHGNMGGGHGGGPW